MGKPFTVRDLLLELKQLIRKGTIDINTPIIYSQDDEGNNYQGVNYLPNPIQFTQKLERGEYLSRDSIYDEAHDDKEELEIFTYLCIN